MFGIKHRSTKRGEPWPGLLCMAQGGNQVQSKWPARKAIPICPQVIVQLPFMRCNQGAGVAAKQRQSSQQNDNRRENQPDEPIPLRFLLRGGAGERKTTRGELFRLHHQGNRLEWEKYPE
jgi:hypothetical protein